MVEGAWLHLTNPLISGIWHFEILIRRIEEKNYRPTCFSPNLGTAVMNNLPIGLWRWRLKKLSFSQRQRLPRRRLKNQRLGWILNFRLYVMKSGFKELKLKGFTGLSVYMMLHVQLLSATRSKIVGIFWQLMTSGQKPCLWACCNHLLSFALVLSLWLWFAKRKSDRRLTERKR